ncbi:MAG: phosphate ABC transporter permease subunit PstC [Microbacteriaceae bacterium]|nr:phosphate ABC transporter permease subunit PstC [Microbacteriaceae bacterium]
MSVASNSTKTIPAKRKLAVKPHLVQDKIFFGIARAAAIGAVAIVGLILAYLLYMSGETIAQQGPSFIFGDQWSADDPNNLVFQIGPMLWGSLLIAFNGIVIAVPMALAAAYFIEFLANGRVAKIATTVVDLLAAIPSIVIGLWGLSVLTPVASHWSQLLHEYLGFLPFFANETGSFVGSPFIAGWIVAVMIVPIITSVTREIFSQLDKDVVNAATALGASRSTTFFQVILPTASGGIVGGILLGLGRALGETVAIFFVLNLSFEINWVDVAESRGGSIASHIVNRFGSATPAEMKALMAAGLVLFVITLLINWLAAVIVAKAQPWRK